VQKRAANVNPRARSSRIVSSSSMESSSSLLLLLPALFGICAWDDDSVLLFLVWLCVWVVLPNK